MQPLLRQTFHIFSVLLLIILLLSLLANFSPADELRVGIIGDQTGSDNIAESYAILGKGINILAGQNVRAILHMGDMIESSKKPKMIRRHYTQATQIIDRLKKPWFLTPGDHDVNPPQFQPNSDDRSRETLFKKLYSANVPEVTNHLYYSFDIDNYHFIALYSQENLHVDPRWGVVFLARISDVQFQWLAQDLKEHENAKAIVIFMHQPLWYNWSNWLQVHKLIREYPVVAVVAGHFHYDQDDGTIDGIRYVIVGATGGRLKQAHREAGNAHQVCIMTLKEQQVNFQLISVESEEPMCFTPRVDMDRVQALDQLLGTLWDFADKNQIFLQGGKLVASCTKDEPAKIRLRSIGNPLDLPLHLKINYLSDKIIINSAGFRQGICQKVINDYECILTAGSRILVANTSLVTPNQAEEPLWEAEVMLAKSEVQHEQSSINIAIQLSFTSEQGEMFITRRATTHLRKCPD